MPRGKNPVVGLYLMMHIQPPPAMRLEPQQCGFLVPDSALSVEENGFHHLLLMLRYGRSPDEVDLFMRSLLGAFPLLVHLHTLYSAADHDALYRLRQRFMKLAGLKTWCIQEALAEFPTLNACVAFLRAQVHPSLYVFIICIRLLHLRQDLIPDREAHWTKDAQRRALQRVRKYAIRTHYPANTEAPSFPQIEWVEEL